MEHCEIFIKKQNIQMPNSDIIMKCYEKFGYKYITLFFIKGKYIFIDKEIENPIEFIEELYKDVNEKDGFVIVFHNENQSNYYDINKERLFYRTTQTIAISKNDCNCLNNVLNIDKDKYNPLFQMFLHDNFYIEINTNCIKTYGNYFKYKNYICSSQLEETDHETSLVKVINVFNKNNISIVKEINDLSYKKPKFEIVKSNYFSTI